MKGTAVVNVRNLDAGYGKRVLLDNAVFDARRRPKARFASGVIDYPSQLSCEVHSYGGVAKRMLSVS